MRDISTRMIQRRVARLGCELDNLHPRDFAAFAPRGQVFVASDCHCIVASGWDDETPAQVRRRLWDDLALGLRPCDDPTCEQCT